MKQTLKLIAFSLALAAPILAKTATPVAAQNPPPPSKSYPINVDVGQAVAICTTGTIICPARSPICDDTSVVTVRDGKNGLEIVGVKRGKTLCSVVSATAFRTIYAVTVR
jgi:hypothetical protein